MTGEQFREVVLLELGDMLGTAGKEAIAAVCRRVGRVPTGAGDHLVGQIVDARDLRLRHRDRPTDDVLQFANVARPLVALEHLVGIGRQAARATAHLLRRAMRKRLGKQADVVTAEAKRRQRKG